jgi:hypothetical protein
MIENNFFPATRPMRYLLDAFRKRLIPFTLIKLESEENNYQPLLSEKVPVVQPLRLHQVVVDCRKIRDADD